MLSRKRDNRIKKVLQPSRLHHHVLGLANSSGIKPEQRIGWNRIVDSSHMGQLSVLNPLISHVKGE